MRSFPSGFGERNPKVTSTHYCKACVDLESGLMKPPWPNSFSWKNFLFVVFFVYPLYSNIFQFLISLVNMTIECKKVDLNPIKIKKIIIKNNMPKSRHEIGQRSRRLLLRSIVDMRDS